MRRRFLKFLATFTFRHAGWMFAALGLVTALSILTVRRMEVDTSLVAFLPPASAESRNIREIVADSHRLEPILAIIRAREAGHEADLKGIASELARLLDDPHYFSIPVYKVDEMAQSYYESLSDVRLIQLLTKNDWGDLHRLMGVHLKKMIAYRMSAFLPSRLSSGSAQDPLGVLERIRGRMAFSRGPTRLETQDGYFLSRDGRAISVLLYPVTSPENGRDATRTLRFLERSREFLLERNTSWAELVDIEFIGPHVTVGRQIEQVQDDFDIILTISFPLAILLIVLVFRKLEAILFIMLPPGVGLLWTLGLATAVFDGISAVTASFLIIITAIGLMYGVHLYHRFTQELYRNHSYYRALSKSYVETGRGVLASAVVVSVLFLLLFVTSLSEVEGWAGVRRVLQDSRGFAQLGIVSAWGILCNIFACMLLLPLMASVKHLLARGRVKPIGLYRFHFNRLYDPAVSRPRMTLCVMLLICVYFGYQARELNFYPRFASVGAFFYQSRPDSPQPDPASGGFPRPGRPIIAVVKGPTFQGALDENDRLYENLAGLEAGEFNVLSYDSLRTVLPSKRSQRASLDELKGLAVEPILAAIEEFNRRVGIKAELYEPFFETLQAFKQRADQPDYIEYSASESAELISTVQRFTTSREDGYYVATMIYPHADGFNPDRFDELVATLGRGLKRVRVIGTPVTERELRERITYNLAVMILMSILTILLGLILHYRNARLAWLTFLPVAAATIWVCGAMAMTGIQIHYFTVLIIPLVVSLALDNSLQLTQYYHDRHPCSVRQVMRSLGRVVGLTCGLMALLFGTFSLTSHPGMRQMGGVVLLAAAGVLFGSAMLLPALLQLFGRGQPIQELLNVESETHL